jgi:hypothetical protein
MKTKKDIILDEIFNNDPYGILNTVEEDNEIIAEFMGFGNVGSSKILYAVILDNKAIGYKSPEDLEFNSSWDWLMAVVKKVDNIKDQVLYDLESAVLDVDIERVHEQVSRFIKRYNYLTKDNSYKPLYK